MFSWFKPRCPLHTGDQAWIEYRLRWLTDRFGENRIRRMNSALPEDLWPDLWLGTEDDARTVYARLCDRMEVASPPPLKFVDDERLPGAAGHYDSTGRRSVIRLKRSQLENPLPLTATLAHEIAHEILLGGGHQTGHESDLEWTTDLLPVIYGVGIFAANATIRFEA